MRRFTLLLALLVVVLVGVVALGARPVAVAQESSPAAGGEMQMPPGLTAEPLALALGVQVPSPADLIVVRIGLEPGAVLPLDTSDPTGGILLIESGTVTVRAETPLSVWRGAALTAGMATAEAGGAEPTAEAIASGQEVVLQVGDSAYIPGSIGGEIRNDGTEPAAGLAFLVGPAGEMPAAATPAP